MSDVNQSSELNLFLIYARATNGTIGLDGSMPWHVNADLKRFKKLTLGKPMIMGRKTFESFPAPLPGRRHIVLTRDRSWSAEGAEGAHSVGDALALASRSSGEVAVIGGAEIYALFEPLASRIELTDIHRKYRGDTYMAALGEEWHETAREDVAANNELPAYSWITLERSSK